MQWFKSLNKAVGLRRYIISGTITLTLFCFDMAKPYLKRAGMSELIGIPSWGVGIIVGLGFLLFWSVQRLVILDRRISGARAALAVLRKEGVEIRNNGIQLKDANSWMIWTQSVNKWQEDVYKKLKEISEGDAELFNVLDIVPEPPRIECYPFNNEHTKLFREHDCRLDRLGQMIYSFWRE